MVAPETMEAFLAMVRLVDTGSFRAAEEIGNTLETLCVSAAPMRVYQDLRGKFMMPYHFPGSAASFLHGQCPDS
jgi:uncharacterized protein YfaP (DUF2135 family)